MKLTFAAIFNSILLSYALLSTPITPRSLPEMQTYIILPQLSYQPGECFEPPSRVQARHQQLTRIAQRALRYLDSESVIHLPKGSRLGEEMYLVLQTRYLNNVEKLRQDSEISKVFKLCQYAKH